MDVDEPPPPGTQFNEGEPTSPRPAATVVLVRDSAGRLEALLVQRNPAARFMGGVWVFPGGAVDPGDGEGEGAYRNAALRELAEETGILLPDPGVLEPVSRWITPPQFKLRFDTHFFLAALEEDQPVRIDNHECVRYGWLTPREALHRFAAKEIQLVLPTVRHLERLDGFSSGAEALDWAARCDVEVVRPQLRGDGDAARVVVQ